MRADLDAMERAETALRFDGCFNLATAVANASEEIRELRAVHKAAKVALATCRESMEKMKTAGVRSAAFRSGGDQFAAAWRDLKEAVEKVET